MRVAPRPATPSATPAVCAASLPGVAETFRSRSVEGRKGADWLGHHTGQLGTRDAHVNNIGSMLDPKATQLPVPEGM